MLQLQIAEAAHMFAWFALFVPTSMILASSDRPSLIKALQENNQLS
jgi:hypothetical protein